MDSRKDPPPSIDVSARPVVDAGPGESGANVSDRFVEQALSAALAKAAAAERWDIVAQLVRELEARRLARRAP